MSAGRIVVRLDRGLGWTLPAYVAGCAHCGTELARRRERDAAERAATRRRCPGCGTRTARQLPGRAGLAADLARAAGGELARRRLADRQSTPRRASGRG